MGYRRTAQSAALGALCLALAAGPELASAQIVANPFQGGAPADGIPSTGNPADNGNGNGNGVPRITIPGTIIPQPRSNLTPEQIRAILMYRALQSRGRGQVKRGVPQFIPLGMPAFVPFAQDAGVAQDPPPDDGKKEARKQRLIEARKAAEEKRRAAREARIAAAKDKAAAARRANAAAVQPPADAP